MSSQNNGKRYAILGSMAAQGNTMGGGKVHESIVCVPKGKELDITAWNMMACPRSKETMAIVGLTVSLAKKCPVCKIRHKIYWDEGFGFLLYEADKGTKETTIAKIKLTVISEMEKAKKELSKPSENQPSCSSSE